VGEGPIGGPLLFTRKIAEWLQRYGVPAESSVPMVGTLQPVTLVDDATRLVAPLVGVQSAFSVSLNANGTGLDLATCEIEVRGGGILLLGSAAGSSTYRVQVIQGTAIDGAPTILGTIYDNRPGRESIIRTGHTPAAGTPANTPQVSGFIFPVNSPLFIPAGSTLRFMVTTVAGNLVINVCIFEEIPARSA